MIPLSLAFPPSRPGAEKSGSMLRKFLNALKRSVAGDPVQGSAPTPHPVSRPPAPVVTVPTRSRPVPPRSGPIRVFVTDDHDGVRDWVKYRLAHEPGFEVVGEAVDGPGVLSGIAETQPDLLTLDLNIPDFARPTATIQTIAEQYPTLAILIISAYSDPTLAAELIEAGARGYVPKAEASHDLVAALRQLADGGSWISPEVEATLARRRG